MAEPSDLISVGVFSVGYTGVDMLQQGLVGYLSAFRLDWLEMRWVVVLLGTGYCGRLGY